MELCRPLPLALHARIARRSLGGELGSLFFTIRSGRGGALAVLRRRCRRRRSLPDPCAASGRLRRGVDVRRPRSSRMTWMRGRIGDERAGRCSGSLARANRRDAGVTAQIVTRAIERVTRGGQWRRFVDGTGTRIRRAARRSRRDRPQTPRRGCYARRACRDDRAKGRGETAGIGSAIWAAGASAVRSTGVARTAQPPHPRRRGRARARRCGLDLTKMLGGDRRRSGALRFAARDFGDRRGARCGGDRAARRPAPPACRRACR